jgi:hypothetical protein
MNVSGLKKVTNGQNDQRTSARVHGTSKQTVVTLKAIHSNLSLIPYIEIKHLLDSLNLFLRQMNEYYFNKKNFEIYIVERM